MDRLTELTQAILLLTSDFLKEKDPKISPLTAKEWKRFSRWLYDNKFSPEDLLEVGYEDKLTLWTDETISKERLHLLLNRGVALAIAMEKWQQMGIWVLTKAPEDKNYYPKQLKEHCKKNAPPILYGVGNKEILNQADNISLEIPNDPSKSAMKYLKAFTRDVVSNKDTILISEIDKKNDQLVENVLSDGGKIIILVSKDLLGATLSKKYRNGLMQNQLVIISPCYPESDFCEENQKNSGIYFAALSSLSVELSVFTQTQITIQDRKSVPDDSFEEMEDMSPQTYTQATLDFN